MEGHELRKKISILLTAALLACLLPSGLIHSANAASGSMSPNTGTESNASETEAGMLSDGEVGGAEESGALSEASPENAAIAYASPSVTILVKMDGEISLQGKFLRNAVMKYAFADYGSVVETVTGEYKRDSVISVPSEYENKPFRVYAWAEGNNGETTIYNTLTCRDIYYKLAVTASPESGHVESGTVIRLRTKIADTEIYYTTDGTMPDETSRLYSAAEGISITKDTIIIAAAYYTDPEKYSEEKGWEDGFSGVFRYTCGDYRKDRYEDNDDFARAARLTFPGRYEALISNTLDQDYYQFTLDKPQKVYARLTVPSNTSYGLKLYRDDQSEIAESVISLSDQSISADTLAAGTYYVYVYSLNGSSDLNEYTLRLYNGEKIATANDSVDFSEANMITAWYGSASGDQTAYTGSRGKRDIEGGGSPYMGINYFSSWDGPVDEKLDSYSRLLSSENKDRAYHNLSNKSDWHLQAAVMLPTAINEDMDTLKTQLKNLVYTYGAVQMSMDWYDPYESDDGRSYYMDDAQAYLKSQNDREIGGGHAITLVGWDDHYSKDNFANSGKHLATYGYPQATVSDAAPGDGAWIIKNSWGTVEGESGYYYISYYSSKIFTGNPIAYIMEEGKDNYNRQYVNDKSGVETSGLITPLRFSSGSMALSNRFTADANDQLLKAVSLATLQNDLHYSISVTVGDETTTVLDGTEKYAGYYTHRLERPVLIPAGADFTLTETLYSDHDQELFYPCCFTGREEDGISYLYSPDQKEDLSKMGVYPCLRAFTLVPDDDSSKVIYRKAGSTGSSAGSSNVSGSKIAASGNLVVSGEPASSFGLKNEYFSYSSDPVEASLPDRYDLREQGFLTSVKNQNPLGTCWSFAACAAAESSVLINRGTRIDYDRKLTLRGDTDPKILIPAGGSRTLNLTADLKTQAGDTSDIYWYLAGDTDSVKLETEKSTSGEEVPVLTFTKPGIVTVIAACGFDINTTDKITYTATYSGITSITLNRSALNMMVGESYQLAADILPEDAYDRTVLWESGNPDVAYVDRNGKVKALKAGTAVITAKGGTAEASCTVTVNESSSGDSNSNVNTDQEKNYTDPVKGHMNTLAGILTGSGDGYSKWISITDPLTRQVTWKLQYADGTNAAGTWEKVNGRWYKFDAGGTMQTGWILDVTEGAGRWYYLDQTNGDMKTGYMRAPDGHAYYLNPDGSMAVGYVVIDGVTHHFNEQLPPSPTYSLDPVTGEWKPNGSNAIPYGAEMK